MLPLLFKNDRIKLRQPKYVATNGRTLVTGTKGTVLAIKPTEQVLLAKMDGASWPMQLRYDQVELA